MPASQRKPLARWFGLAPANTSSDLRMATVMVGCDPVADADSH
jgi:hypothetical protein